MRNSLLSASALLAALAFGVGCGSNGTGTDGGTTDVPVTTDTPVTTDVPVTTDTPVTTDVPTDTGSPLFIACTTNATCTAAHSGTQCLTTFPGGLCTRPCTNDHGCGTGNHCQQGICLPGCMPNGGLLECDQFGAACAGGISATDPTQGICVPACFTMGAPSGWPTCPAASACQVYGGACGGAMPTGTAADGAHCTADTDCLGGLCRLDTDATSGNATGFVGGYCISFGRNPPQTADVQGMPIPQSNCPNGSAAFPGFSNVGSGDETECWATCNTVADCRQGYACDHFQNRMTMQPFFSNGFCVPGNCLAPTNPVTCPTGYSCVSQVTDSATPQGVCTPSAPTDGGTGDSGATDAATGG